MPSTKALKNIHFQIDPGISADCASRRRSRQPKPVRVRPGWTAPSGLLCSRRRTEARVANKKPAIRIAVVLVVVIVAALWLLSRHQVETRAVSGTVEVDEVHVASRYGGRVEKIHAQEGDALPTNKPLSIWTPPNCRPGVITPPRCWKNSNTGRGPPKSTRRSTIGSRSPRNSNSPRRKRSAPRSCSRRKSTPQPKLKTPPAAPARCSRALTPPRGATICSRRHATRAHHPGARTGGRDGRAIARDADRRPRRQRARSLERESGRRSVRQSGSGDAALYAALVGAGVCQIGRAGPHPTRPEGEGPHRFVQGRIYRHY